MHDGKRVYPADRGKEKRICALLLAAAFLIVVSGIGKSQRADDFLLEPLPSPTAFVLDETFDETLTETVADLPGSVWFALQTGAFENEESARLSAEAFQNRGAAGYLWKDGRYRVLAAVYPSKEDAQNVREQLREQHNIDTYLYQITLPAVSLRMKGMQGQMEILQAAFVHAHDLAVQLQHTAVEMDRNELSVREANARLNALKSQLDVVSTRLHQRFSIPVPQIVEGLLDCFQGFSAFAASVDNEESHASFGMKLKFQTLSTLWDIQNLYHILNDT